MATDRHRSRWRSAAVTLVNGATGLLLALGTFRALRVALHEPLIGYANNFDFYRLAQWYGITGVSGEPISMHPEWPLGHYYLHGPRIPGDAYVSSELVFVHLGLWLSTLFGSGESFDLRVIGATRACALIAMVLGFAAASRKTSRQVVTVLAAAFALVLTDPLVTLFLNTLYCEFSAVFFTTVVLGAFALLHRRRRWPKVLVTTAALGLFGLGLSKVQHQALPLALVGAASVPWLFKEKTAIRRRMPALAVLWASAMAAFLIQQREPAPGLNSAIRAANATDTWFGAVFPSFDDPASVVVREGLPPRCAAYVGKTWYDPGMQPPPCVEIIELPRWRCVLLLMSHPAATSRLLSNALVASRPWAIAGYGQVEGRTYGKLSDESMPSARTVMTLFDGLPVSAYATLLLTGTLVFPAVLVISLFQWLRRRPAPLERSAPFAMSLLSLVCGYSFTTALLGDGVVSFAHHFHLGEVALSAMVVVAAAAAGCKMVVHVSRPLLSRDHHRP